MINQLNIISRAGSQITASSGQVNILITSSSNANITNFLVNLSFAMSQGGIALINNIAGVFIFNNYQILGSYQSQSCVSLVGKIASQSTITINNFNFMPIIFNVGNSSSYMFSQVAFTSIQINNTAIILGNKSNSQISNAIITNSSFSYQFSGIISQTFNTILLISKLISDCNQQYSQYIQKSGQLVGIAQQQVNNITIVNICLLQYINTQQYRQSGLIGYQEGNISIQQMKIQYIVNGLLTSIGLIGVQSSWCLQAEISNIVIIFNSIVDLASYGQVSAIVGASSSTQQINFSIINVIVQNSTLESQYYIGAFVGYYSSNTNFVILQNSTVQFSNITGFKQMSGGLIGNSYNVSIKIDNIILQSLRIFAPSKYGIIIGFDNGNTFNIQNSVSIGSNYINNVIVSNCASLTSTSIPKGC
ncbi:Hypothetical_protein [Hexamita inflata]|uniref:Hypothetical_protein n=1 Tax=Hexamita inflata TaxID=28002 RepID=A0AA86Q9Z9_9EUKA|nr:Hypothetical protein HINF_LOCUS40886 [Hexamita inflata]